MSGIRDFEKMFRLDGKVALVTGGMYGLAISNIFYVFNMRANLLI